MLLNPEHTPIAPPLPPIRSALRSGEGIRPGPDTVRRRWRPVADEAQEVAPYPLFFGQYGTPTPSTCTLRIHAGHRLVQPSTVGKLEEGPEVGGVWRENTYPGCSCDVPAHLYSFAFDPYRDARVRYPDQPDGSSPGPALLPLLTGTRLDHDHKRCGAPTRETSNYGGLCREPNGGCVPTAVGGFSRRVTKVGS